MINEASGRQYFYNTLFSKRIKHKRCDKYFESVSQKKIIESNIQPPKIDA